MQTVILATGNAVKFHAAQKACAEFGVTLVQHPLDVPEIQAEEGEPIARDKAEKAFAIFQKPIMVCDDFWMVPGLGNFPGAYMKSVNHWFTPEDWLRLTLPLKDRRIILRQYAVYQDARQQKVFTKDLIGTITTEIRGKSLYAHSTITSFDGGKHTDAQFHEQGESAVQGLQTVWHSVAPWLKEHAQ
ncbi:MAG TPA: non-canonical purine NTP pyrophosphatase [Candidatus Saccharimonadales bacterium]|nr:non-canonical purine NTP pyrophosphatase [Candidatus Saccharimonadales bacterium]